MLNILVLGLDSSILDKNSKLAKRALDYGKLADKYIVIVPALKTQELKLASNITVFGVAGSNKIIILFKIYRLAAKIIKQEKINLISAQDVYYLGLISYLLAKKFKISLELQVHGFEKFSGTRKQIAKYIILKADNIRTVSERLKNNLINNFKAKAEKINVIPIYTEINIKNKILKNKKNKFIFLTVSRLVPVKNIALQIKAFKNLNNKDIELWIAGDGPLINNLKLIINNLELGDKVKLFGYQKDLENFYSQADAFLLTSSSEGYGQVIIEAASYSLPIIMTDVGLAGEVIFNNKNGLIIPINNQEKLEEAMLKIINNQDLRKTLGENAKKTVLNLASKEEILRLYRKGWERAII